MKRKKQGERREMHERRLYIFLRRGKGHPTFSVYKREMSNAVQRKKDRIMQPSLKPPFTRETAFLKATAATRSGLRWPTPLILTGATGRSS